MTTKVNTYDMPGSIACRPTCIKFKWNTVMHNRMMDYFTSNELFSSQQYGFRPNRSIELAALELMDRNIDNMSQNFSPINIYIDLCKAFDCLDHAILFSKLKYYGLNDNANKLLKKLSI